MNSEACTACWKEGIFMKKVVSSPVESSVAACMENTGSSLDSYLNPYNAAWCELYSDMWIQHDEYLLRQ